MTYLELRNAFKNRLIFSLAEIRLFETHFNLIQLLRWQKAGYIRKIIRGWYVFSDTPLSEELLMFMANKIIIPSYVSLEFAFSFYHLIPEGVFQITSITSKKTQQYNSLVATFHYRHLKSELMFGYHLETYSLSKICIADLEKAILDFLYLTPEADSHHYFDEMRLNADVLKKLDLAKLNVYLKIFNHTELMRRTKRFLDYVNDQ